MLEGFGKFNLLKIKIKPYFKLLKLQKRNKQKNFVTRSESLLNKINHNRGEVNPFCFLNNLIASS